MLNVLRPYADSQTNEFNMKTNFILLSSYFDHIDWIHVNKLRLLIRDLVETNLKHIYYRGLTLSDREIQYFTSRNIIIQIHFNHLQLTN
jgi:hypothetical protein